MRWISLDWNWPAAGIGLLFVALSFAPIAAQESAAPAPPALPAPAAEIRQWIKALDSDRFLDRENATEKLIAAGGASVPAIAEALRGSNLEVTTRGVFILQELALDFNRGVDKAAREALENLAAARTTAAARRAAATLAVLDTIRRERAVQELKQLGAVVTDQPVQLGFEIINQYSIEIGETWRGQTADLIRLRWLSELNELTLSGPQVTDEWLEHVGQVGQVTMLKIRKAAITDAGLKHLAALRRVEILALQYVPITDQAVDSLKQITNAGTIMLIGTKVSIASADQLRVALATTKIDHRDGAFLGVGCQATELGCTIYTVRPATAAAEAGLLPGDVIVEYEGKPLGDFETLTTYISRNSAGDTVSMKILRNETTSIFKVKLGEWD